MDAANGLFAGPAEFFYSLEDIGFGNDADDAATLRDRQAAEPFVRQDIGRIPDAGFGRHRKQRLAGDFLDLDGRG